jgi:hypothetical protein
MQLANFASKIQCGRETVTRVGMQSCGAKRVVGGAASQFKQRSVVSLGKSYM